VSGRSSHIFWTIGSQMVVRLSALRAGRPSPPRNIPGTHLRWRLSRPEGHSAAGRIRSTEKSNDLIGNRTRDLPACSLVPPPPKIQVFTYIVLAITMTVRLSPFGILRAKVSITQLISLKER
jgi:hypothetical protein